MWMENRGVTKWPIVLTPCLFHWFHLGASTFLTAQPGDGSTAKRCKQQAVAAGQSAVLDTLLDLVGKGSAHIETVAQIARAVKSDSQQPVHEGLQRIAACGAHGKHDANTERDFQRLLRGSNDFFVEPYSIRLTLQVTPPRSSNSCFFCFRPSPCPLPRFNTPTMLR